MNCSEFETQLDERFAASGLTETRELAEHAAQCVDCQIRWTQYRLLAESIVVWRDQTPEADLVESVIAARQIFTDCCDSDENRDLAAVSRALIESRSAQTAAAATHNAARERRHMSARFLALASLAALLCVMIAIWSLRDNPSTAPTAANHRGDENPVAADRTPATEPPAANRLASASRTDGAGREGTEPKLAPELAPYSTLVQMARSAFSEATVLILPDATAARMLPREAPSPADGSTEPDGWIDGLQQQLRPVGRSLGNAFDFLWQAGQSVDG
jgi:hypothetical protein